MASEKTEGIVLRLTEFSESSLVVSMFTRDFGLVSAMAKGARRPKSAFEGALDLLCLCRVVIIRKSGDSLDLLTEAKLERRFRAAQKNLRSLYAGYYAAELVRELTERDVPQPELFHYLADTLQAFDRQSPIDLDAELMRFELRALKSLGHAPTMESCAVCGGATSEMMTFSNPENAFPARSPSFRTEKRILYSPFSGGVVCESCRGQARGTIVLRPETVQWFNSILQDSPENNSTETTTSSGETVNSNSISLPAECRPESRAAITQTITHLYGAPLRLTRYLSGTHG